MANGSLSFNSNWASDLLNKFGGYDANRVGQPAGGSVGGMFGSPAPYVAPVAQPTPQTAPVQTSAPTPTPRFPRQPSRVAAPPHASNPNAPASLPNIPDVSISSNPFNPGAPDAAPAPVVDPNSTNGTEVINGSRRQTLGAPSELSDPVQQAQDESGRILQSKPSDLWGGSNPEAYKFRKQLMDAFDSADTAARDNQGLNLGHIGPLGSSGQGRNAHEAATQRLGEIGKLLGATFAEQGTLNSGNFKNVNEGVNNATKTGYEGEHNQANDANETQKNVDWRAVNDEKNRLEALGLPSKIALEKAQASAAEGNLSLSQQEFEARKSGGMYERPEKVGKYSDTTVNAGVLGNHGFDPTPDNLAAYESGDTKFVPGTAPKTGLWSSLSGSSTNGTPPHMIPKGAVDTGKVDPATGLPIYTLKGKNFLPSIYGQVPKK
jgi:hypothetical protein